MIKTLKFLVRLLVLSLVSLSLSSLLTKYCISPLISSIISSILRNSTSAGFNFSTAWMAFQSLAAAPASTSNSISRDSWPSLCLLSKRFSKHTSSDVDDCVVNAAWKLPATSRCFRYSLPSESTIRSVKLCPSPTNPFVFTLTTTSCPPAIGSLTHVGGGLCSVAGTSSFNEAANVAYKTRNFTSSTNCIAINTDLIIKPRRSSSALAGVGAVQSPTAGEVPQSLSCGVSASGCHAERPPHTDPDPSFQPGVLPPLPQAGVLPPEFQAGVFPPEFQAGVLPPEFQAGVLPPEFQAGVLPPEFHAGVLPPLPQAGVFPPLPQAGVFPPLPQAGVLPPLLQAGVLPPPGPNPPPLLRMDPPFAPFGGPPEENAAPGRLPR
ncbi:hypothetical protein OGAPHI_000198 [Ogataea philodendri]|uniref:Uncharacterized protein n=1 Tax=Ogataea philodendri TaxID=1378263 RepID=A0A9P8TAV8_9ASCO|nr:uncharacterized protein OGAPHI_000198 [Ogataea philodendri]KAH3671496.1 hypothetical protein OGAPHI_000198 [Ogataea philodendri]